jgi:hypothetical protein
MRTALPPGNFRVTRRDTILRPLLNPAGNLLKIRLRRFRQNYFRYN